MPSDAALAATFMSSSAMSARAWTRARTPRSVSPTPGHIAADVGPLQPPGELIAAQGGDPPGLNETAERAGFFRQQARRIISKQPK